MLMYRKSIEVDCTSDMAATSPAVTYQLDCRLCICEAQCLSISDECSDSRSTSILSSHWPCDWQGA